LAIVEGVITSLVVRESEDGIIIIEGVIIIGPGVAALKLFGDKVGGSLGSWS